MQLSLRSKIFSPAEMGACKLSKKEKHLLTRQHTQVEPEMEEWCPAE